MGNNESIKLEDLPFDIPDNWVWVRHNSIFEICGGSQPPKNKFITVPKDGYIRLYQIRDYGPKPDPVYISINDARKFTKKGDILLARYGASVGKIFIAEDGAYNVAMAKVEKLYIGFHVNKTFLFNFYKSNIYQSLVLNNSRSAQSGFNKSDLNELLIPLPPLSEQQRIVNKINSFEPLLQEYEKLEKKLTQLELTFSEELKKSILQLAIQGKLVKQDLNDEPASELVKKIYKEKKKLIAEGKIKKDKNESYIFKCADKNYYEKIGKNEPKKLEDLPFDIPDNWTWVRQKNICWLDNGVKSKGEKLPYLEAKVIRGLKEPVIHTSGIIVDSTFRVILVDGENSGEIMIPPFKGYMGSTFKIFSAVKSFNYDFLLNIFSLDKEMYRNTKIGAAIPHLNKQLFRESLIALPPLNEQQRIVDKIILLEKLL